MELRISDAEDIIVSSERIEQVNGEKQSFTLVIHGNGSVYVTMWREGGKEETRVTTIGDMFQNGTILGPPFGEDFLQEEAERGVFHITADKDGNPIE